MKKTRKLNSIILKSFIILAVVMMLISMLPAQGEINEKNKNSLDGGVAVTSSTIDGEENTSTSAASNVEREIEKTSNNALDADCDNIFENEKHSSSTGGKEAYDLWEEKQNKASPKNFRDTDVSVNGTSLTGNQYYPDVASGIDGRIYVAWSNFNEAVYRIYCAVSTDGGVTFGTSVGLPVPATAGTDHCIMPQVAVYGTGATARVHVVYAVQYSGSDFDIYYANSTNGGASFQSTAVVIVNTANNENRPDIAVDAGGNPHIAFVLQDITTPVQNHYVYTRRSTDQGATWQAAVIVAGGGTTVVYNWVAIAINGTGITAWVHVGYQSSSGGWNYYGMIYYEKSTDGGATYAGTVVNIATDANYYTFRYGTLAADPNGNPHIVYMKYVGSASNNDVYYNRSTNGGASFLSGITIANTGCNENNPKIALDGKGNPFIIWNDNRSSTENETYLTWSDDGGSTFVSAANAIIINSATTGNQEYPSIAVYGGNATSSDRRIDIVWEDWRSGTDCDIYYDGCLQWNVTITLTGTSSPDYLVNITARTYLNTSNTPTGLYSSWSGWCDNGSTLTFNDTTYPATPANTTTDTCSWTVTSAFSETITYTGANNPPTPENLGVQGYLSGTAGILNITDHTPDLNYTYTDTESDTQSWRNVSVYNISSGAVIWSSNVSDSQSSGSNVIVTYAGSTALQDGLDYYFNVTCNDTGSNNWSAVASVKFRMNTLPTASNIGVQGYISAPSILNITNHTPDINWTYSDAEGSAQSDYNVSVWTGPGRIGTLMGFVNTTGSVTSWTYSGSALIDGQDYYANVQVKDGYEWSSWSEVKFHMNTLPTVSNIGVEGFLSGTSGILNITNHTPNINWTYSDPEGSTQANYNVSVWTGPGRTGTLMGSVNTTGSVTSWTYTGSQLVDGTDYYANVQTKDGYEWSTWAEVKFHMNTPPPTPTTPIIPTNGATGISTTTALNWTSVTDAEGSSITYYWYIDDDEGFSFPLVDSGTAGTNTSGVLSSLSGGTKYYWRVRAYDGYEYGENSTTWNFTTASGNQPPNPPTLTAPANDTWNNSATINFTWSYFDPEGNPQNGFNITISNNSDFSVINYTANVTSSNPYKELTLSDGTWYWKVKVNDTNDAWSNWSGWRIINIDTSAPTVTAVSPAPDATNVAITTTIIKTFSENMNQTSVENNFKVYQDGSATPVAGIYSWSGNECIFTPGLQLSPDTKYWGNVSTDAKDLAGNQLGAANNTWFITAAGVGATVNAPNGDEAWKGNTNYWIDYTISGGTGPYTVKLYYSTSGANGPWNFIAYHNRTSEGIFNYTWLTPTTDFDNCFVNVSVNDSTSSGYDLSNNPFTIDSSAPTSSASISPYWWNEVITVSAEASDNLQLKNITLYYAYSSNNNTWPALAVYTKGEIKEISGTSWSGSFSFSASDEGYYRFYTRAYDEAGNPQDIPGAYQASAGYDTTSPSNPSSATEQNGAENNTWQNSVSSPTFEWSWPSDNLAGVDGFYWYFGTSSTGTSTNYITTNTSSLGNAENNTYYFRVRTRDKAGNNASWVTIFVFKHDAVLPVTIITIVSGTLGTNGWYISDVTVNLTAEENLSGLLKIEYRIGETWEPYTGNFPYAVEDNTTIYAISTDNAGNIESSWKYKFVLIDKTSPTSPNLLAPENDTWTNNSIIFFDWDDSSDQHSKIANYTLQVSKDKDFSYFNYTSPTIEISEHTSSLLADGIYYWRIVAKDNAGNDNTSDVWLIGIDTEPPGVPTPISPMDETPYNTPMFEWTKITDTPSGLSNYTLQVSKGISFYPEDIIYESNPSTNTSTPTSTIDDGIYFWRVRAVDNASNHGDWSSKATFQINSGAVTGLELKINNGAEYTNSTHVTLTILVDNPPDNPPYYVVNFSNDGNTWSGWESYSESRDWDLSNPDYGGDSTEGEKTVYVRCKKSDDVTVFAQSDSSIILDLNPPQIALQSPSNDVWVNYSLIEFKWKAYDNFELSGNYGIQIWNHDKSVIVHAGLVSGSMINNGTSTYSYSFLDEGDGKYYWRIKARDKANNWSSFTNYWLLKIDTEKPGTIGLILPDDNFETSENVVSFSWENLTDLSGVAYYTLQISRNPEFSDLIPSVDTAINKTTQTLPEATYWWRVRATDNAGNVGDWSSEWRFIISTGGPTNLQILVNAGATETNNESVYLVVYAVNATEMCFSNDGNIWSGWENYDTIKEWELEWAEEGNKTNRTVYFKCRNEYKESTPVHDSILVNKKPPIVTITTPSQAMNVSYITIHWTCDQPIGTIDYFEVCSISSEYSDGPKEWINAGKNYSYYFTNLEEGYHIIYARGKRTDRDEPGGAHSIWVLIDSLPPTNLQMDFLNTSVVNDIEYTNSTIINITLNAEDDASFTKFVSGIDKFYISNDNITWHPYDYTGFPVTITWDLTKNVADVDGSKNVYFKVFDRGGNWNITSASIFLDRKEPINLEIGMVHCDLFDGNVETTTITLNLSAEDDWLYEMCFSENGTIWTDWIDYNESYIYEIQNTTYPIKIYFKIKDRAGNVNETSFDVGLLDLSITQMSFEPSDTIPIGTNVLINATISNVGENDAVNVTIWFYKYDPTNPENELDGSPILIPFIGKGETVSVSLSYSQWETGSFPIWVWVDRENKIVEIKEGIDNNSLSATVHFVSTLDVVPTDITFSVNGAEPPYIFEDDTVTITAEIINLGGYIKIPFWVEFWFGDFENNTFNGSLIGKTQVGEILPYETKDISIIWNADVGHYKIWVFLNTTNLPNENAENNWFNKTFRVYPPTAIKFQVSVSLLTTDPSGTLSYSITIENIGKINDTYNLSVEDLPSGWSYSFFYNGNEIKNVTLETGETIEILLRVKGGDKPGTYRFRVVASSQKDPRAVYDTELTAKIKEPFPWYLLIILIIAAAVIAVIGLLVKKGVIVVKEKPERVKIEPGYNYLIKGGDVRKAYHVFMQLTKKMPGLCITSTHPRKRREGYKLGCLVCWLTDVTKTDEKTLHPERLDFELFKTVSDFVKEKHGIVMLDGIEYLVHVNGFERAMDFIDSIRDAISTHNGTLVVPANPSVFKEEELGMLEKRFDRILG